MIQTSPDSSPTKHLSLTVPDFNTGSQRNESGKTLTSKMKKMLASPKVMRGKSIPSLNKTFGIPLENLTERDAVDVPLIVSRICEYLKKHGLNQEGLFRVNGNMKVVERLKVAFDKCGDADLEEIGDVPAAASLLKLFLRELTDPVIPEDLQRVLIAIQDKYSKDKSTSRILMKNLVKQLPQPNGCLLKYLCAFMLGIAENSEKNKMTALALAIVFGPSLFRCGEGLEGLREQAFVNAVLLHMLQDYDYIFSPDVINNDRFEDFESLDKPAAYLEHVRQKKNKEKPARPPPPQFNIKDSLNIVSKNKDKESTPKKQKTNNSKGSRKASMDRLKTPQKRKGSSDTSGNTSPTTSISSPLTKQLLDSTINSAVKEHLFGPGMLTQSTESDMLEDLIMQDSSREKVLPQENISINPTTSEYMNSQKKITENDLAYLQQNSHHTLQSLTSKRAGPPKNRRKPSSMSQSSISSSSTEETQLNGRYSDFTMASNSEYMITSEVREDSMLHHSIERDDGSFLITPLKAINDQESSNIVPPINLSRLIEEENEPPKSPRDRFKFSHQDEESDLQLPSLPNIGNNELTSQGKKRHEMWMEKRQDTVPIVEMAPQDLKKRIISLKKVIQNFESNFESQNGVKPNPSDKAPIQKYIAELGRTKKQLKELLSDYHENLDLLTETAPIGSDHGTSPNLREPVHTELSGKESTLNLLLKRLGEKRSAQGRPHEIQAMTIEQLKDEKLSVQKALLQYENLHGRPTSKEDKTLMRPLYDRYRKIKRLIATGKASTNVSDRPTISQSSSLGSPLHHPRHQSSNIFSDDEKEPTSLDSSNYNPSTPFSRPLEEKRYTQSLNEQTPSIDSYDSPTAILSGDTFSLTRRLTSDTLEPLSPPLIVDSPRSIDEAVLHNATIPELLEQQRATKRAKKRLGKLLKEYEDDFYNMWNRKVQKDDRLPREAEYREYKLIKSKLRLVEALIAKKAANHTV